MAAPTNTYQTTATVGIREDLTDAIYNIDPDDVPFLTTCARTKATQHLHEWQTDALRASADNAHLEGDDVVADAASATVRLNNRTQIFVDSVSLSRSNRTTKKAGRGDEMAYQLMKRMKEHRLDIERALFLNQPKVARSDTIAGRLAGVPTWLTTNTVFESGSSGADPTGDGSNARTDNGTLVAFSQTRLNTCLQSRWVEGGDKTGVSVYLSAFQMDKALGFVGNNAQRANIDAKSGRVINMMDVYVTSFGTVKFVMSRENRGRDVLVLQDDMWKIAYFQPTKTEELAKTGDSDRRFMVTELTLVCANEKASGAVYDNTIS